MAILNLVIAPDPLLKQPSLPVETIDQQVLTLLDDLVDTMYAARGIGLSAVQVGVLKKLVVVDVGWREEEDVSRGPMKFINPEIIWDSDEPSIYNEGCLSFPEQYSEVERPKQVKVRYLDIRGEQQILEADGLLATCIQHEIDHTNGITFVDHISRMKRDIILRRLTKGKKQGLFDGHVHGEHCHHHHDD